MPTTSLSLFRFCGLASRFWVLGQMGLARLDLRREPHALFWKLCGSGTGEGFTPRPNWDVWAILATWPDEATARARTRDNPVYARWRTRAVESWTVYLAPTSARGHWAGVNPFLPDGTAIQIGTRIADPGGTPTTASGLGAPSIAPLPDAQPKPSPGPAAQPLACAPSPHLTPSCGPIAALTRATIRPSRAVQFWRRVPGISAVIGTDPNVAFKIGIGEVPLLHQVTFSIWPDAAAMAHFARGDGPHGRAIRAVREDGWFAEELYARFRILGSDGHWAGADPLASLAPRVAA